MRRYLSLILAFLISIPVFLLPSSAAAPALAAEAGAAFLEACGFSLSSAAIADTFPQAWAEYTTTPLSTYDDDVRVLASGNLSIGGVFWGALRGFIDWLRDEKGITNTISSSSFGSSGFVTTDGRVVPYGTTNGDDFYFGSVGFGVISDLRWNFPGGSSILISNSGDSSSVTLLLNGSVVRSSSFSGLRETRYPIRYQLTVYRDGTCQVNLKDSAPGGNAASATGTKAFVTGLGAVGGGDLTISGDIGADISVPLPREGQQDRDVVVVGGLGVGAGATAAEISTAIQQGIAAGTLSATATVTSQAGADTGINYGSADNYTVTGLGEVFPFCIPFDIGRMISGFSVPAEAPVIELPFHFDAVGIREDIVIDFSDYSSVALVARRVELVAFCVGLAIATRRLIWG